MTMTARILVITLTILLVSGAGRQAAHATSASPDEEMLFFLDANVGYGGYYSSSGFLDSKSEAISSAAPIYSGSVSIAWPRRSGSKLRLGIRGSGFYGEMQGDSSSASLFTSSTRAISATLAGGHIGLFGERLGLWGAASAGVLHLQTDSPDPYKSHSEIHTYWAPELCFAIGYSFYLTRVLALRISAEGGFFPIPFHVRGSFHAGVVLRI